jgi:hypothetical protein
MSNYDRTITVDIEDLYGIVNALRDACGCTDCRRIADNILEQNRQQQRALKRAVAEYRQRMAETVEVLSI